MEINDTGGTDISLRDYNRFDPSKDSSIRLTPIYMYIYAVDIKAKSVHYMRDQQHTCIYMYVPYTKKYTGYCRVQQDGTYTGTPRRLQNMISCKRVPLICQWSSEQVQLHVHAETLSHEVCFLCKNHCKL